VHHGQEEEGLRVDLSIARFKHQQLPLTV